MCRWSVFLSLCLSLTAFAQQDARALFEEGSALYERGDFKAAALKFEASWAARPLPVTKYNLARCYAAAGLPLKGIDAAQLYLALRPDAEDRREVEASLLKMGKRLAERRVQALTVISTPEGARVLVDGVFRGLSPLTLELPSGHHLVQVEQEGRERVDRSVSFSLERPLLEALELPLARAPVIVVSTPTTAVPVAPVVLVDSPAPAPPPRASPGTPWLVAGGAIALVGAVGLTWSYVTWGQLQQQRVELPAPATFVSREDLERLRWVYPSAWVAAGVGLAAVAVGVVFVVRDAPVKVSLAPGPGTLTVAGSF